MAIKLAAALEETARYIEALENKQVKVATRSATAPARTRDASVPPQLVAKLAARWDRDDKEVLAELQGVSSTVLEELSKLASDEDLGSTEELPLGGASDYEDPALTKKQASTDMSSNEVWSTLASRWLGTNG